MSNVARKNIFQSRTNNFEDYRRKVESNLFKQLTYVRQLAEPKEIVLDPVDVTSPLFSENPREIRDALGLPPDTHQVIYVMRILNPFLSALDLDSLLNEREQSIANDTEHFTQITGPNRNNLKTQYERLQDVVLYVGTSKSFASRLKTHIGHGSKSTATLCLKKWPHLADKRIKLTIEIYDFGSEIESESLKLLESALSDDLKPLMGRNRRA